MSSKKNETSKIKTTFTKNSISLNKNDIKECIQELLRDGKKVTIAKVASMLGVSHPTISNNLEFRTIVKEAGNIKSLKKVYIDPRSVKQTIADLKKANETITYRNIASRLGCNWWNIQQKPNIKEIVDNHNHNKYKPKYNFTANQVQKIIELIRKKGLKVTQNEVYRQLNCNRSYFRINPDLKALIMNAKREDEKRIYTVIQPLENYEILSPKAQRYEKTYLNYKTEMEKIGKNWRLTGNKSLSEKLNIPLEILLEIKRKYLPYTRKINKIQARKKLFTNYSST